MTGWVYWLLWAVAAVCLAVGVYGRIVKARRDERDRELWDRMFRNAADAARDDWSRKAEAPELPEPAVPHVYRDGWGGYSVKRPPPRPPKPTQPSYESHGIGWTRRRK